MRIIHRVISSALLVSQDWKILLWMKDPSWWWVYAHCWHLPWGWVEEWETLEEAMLREVAEEVWVDVSGYKRKLLSPVWTWESFKTLAWWERVVCKMQFNRFLCLAPHTSDQISFTAWDDFVKVMWMWAQDVLSCTLVPWSIDFFETVGLFDYLQ